MRALTDEGVVVCGIHVGDRDLDPPKEDVEARSEGDCRPATVHQRPIARNRESHAPLFQLYSPFLSVMRP